MTFLAWTTKDTKVTEERFSSLSTYVIRYTDTTHRGGRAIVSFDNDDDDNGDEGGDDGVLLDLLCGCCKRGGVR